MMSMFRFMDDLCVQTTVTPLYGVRTSGDIMFESELEQLRFRLKSYQPHVLLSQPNADWPGLRGRINRDSVVQDTVKDLTSSHFFLTWPTSIDGHQSEYSDRPGSEAGGNHAGVFRPCRSESCYSGNGRP